MPACPVLTTSKKHVKTKLSPNYLVIPMTSQNQSQPAATHWHRLGISRLSPITLAVATIVSVFAAWPMSSPVVAQAVTDSPGRAVPQAWRPSFGSVNQSAIQAQPSTETPVANPSGSILSQPQPPAAGTGSGTRAAAATATNTQGSDTRAAGFAEVTPTRITPPPTAEQREAARRAAAAAIKPGVTLVSHTMNELPNKAGQVWREYDISPYTARITSSKQPEQAVLDWVLRETGSEMWFTQPMGILNVDKDKLIVYHTPEIQAVVKGIVDRLVRTKGQVQTVDVNLITIANPNWRSEAYTMLQPIEVKSPGVEAWLVSKENAAILMGQLSRRSDFEQQTSGRLTNHDGQSFSLDKTRPLQFIRGLRWTPGQAPGYQPLMSTINEGFELQLSCLTTADNASIEAMIKCDVDQVEKLEDVSVTIPTAPGTPRQQVKIQVPQMVSWRLQERFRWPSDEVLLLSTGVVATPNPDVKNGGFKLPGIGGAKRADALLFIDYRGPATGATIATVPSQPSNDRTASSRMGRIGN